VNKLDRIKEYFGADTIQINLFDFSLDILLTALCAYILSKVYEKYGRSLSNRTSFGKNFLLLSLTTMMVISVIRSSIALSLGLVGALSIVRFRSAIKDPEELVYLFLTMAIGLGFGSGNRYLTMIFFVVICAIIIVKERLSKSRPQNPMFLLVNSKNGTDLEKVVQTLDKNLRHIELHRYEQVGNSLEAIFTVKVEALPLLDKITKDLVKLDKDIEVSFTENKGIFD
jgi:uncharacterized membrane protein YhiD involved in acid resistance